MLGGKKRKEAKKLKEEARKQNEREVQEAIKTAPERADQDILRIVTTNDRVVSLYEHKIKIRSLAKSSLWATGLIGEKEIWLDQISAIQLREPKLGLGYIQFVFCR